MDRPRVILGLVAAISVLALVWLNSVIGMGSAAARSTPDVEARHGGIYRSPLLNSPLTLDPAYVRDMYGVAVVQQLFDGLVQFSSDFIIIPALAESWQVEDGGRTYRFQLRGNALFHNGSRVTSKDVVFSLARLLRVEPPSTILPHILKIHGAREYHEHMSQEIAGLKAVDDHTLLIHLNEPYVPFLAVLGMYQTKVVPREAAERNPEEFAAEPIGSGPFRFVSWEKNKEIRLDAFQDYYAGRPYLDRIELAIYPGIDIEEVWSDFQNGKLHQLVVYGGIREKLKERRDLQWVHRPSLSLQFYGFNCADPLLKNPDLRLALRLAIDHEKLVTEAYRGQFEPAMGILPPGLPGYHPQDTKIDEDMDKARSLIRGILDGKQAPTPIEIVSNSQSPLAQAELEFVRKSWARLGIDLKPKFITDWAQFKDYLKSDSLQIYRYAWFADIPDPDDMLRPLFSADSPFNYTRHRDELVDRMLKEALGMVDPIARAERYRQIESMMLGSCPIIPLIHMSIDLVYQANVMGIAVNALGAHTMSFHRVWLRNANGQ